MRSGRGERFIQQDKGIPQQSRNSLSSREQPCGTRLRQCRRVARQRWPIFVALISVVGAALGPRLGVGFNLSRSAPRGVYRQVRGAPVRGAIAVACLPAATAAFGRARGYLGAGDCPGGAGPVLKRIGAVWGDVVGIHRDAVTVNGVRLSGRPIEPLDSAARPLRHIPFGSYAVAAGEVWLFGRSGGQSWDSRYFGPVPAASVRGVVRPVLTVEWSHE